MLKVDLSEIMKEKYDVTAVQVWEKLRDILKPSKTKSKPGKYNYFVLNFDVLREFHEKNILKKNVMFFFKLK